MKAIVFRTINQLPAIEDIDVEGHDLKVDLLCSAFNHRDLWITKGLYPGLKAGIIMGADGMGYCDGQRVLISPGIEWGSNEAFQSQNYRVLGVPDHGTFAEHIYVNKNQLIEAPAYLTDAEAAALPVAGATAYRALMKKCHLISGENVLITGIGGGVALMAGLMSKAAGANVFFTTGDESKLNKALDLGFKAGANYHHQNWVNEIQEASGGIDVIIDSAAGDGFASLIKLCNYGARIAFYGGSKGKISGLNPQPIFWKQISIFGSTMGSDQDFIEMIDFVALHKIRPVIHELLAFEDYQKGFSIMEEGSQFGKICLSI